MKLDSRGDTNSELLYLNFYVIEFFFIYEKVPLFSNSQYLNNWFH